MLISIWIPKGKLKLNQSRSIPSPFWPSLVLWVLFIQTTECISNMYIVVSPHCLPYSTCPNIWVCDYFTWTKIRQEQWRSLSCECGSKFINLGRNVIGNYRKKNMSMRIRFQLLTLLGSCFTQQIPCINKAQIINKASEKACSSSWLSNISTPH